MAACWRASASGDGVRRGRLHGGLFEVDERHAEREAQRGGEVLRSDEPPLEQDRRQRKVHPRGLVDRVLEHIRREDVPFDERFSELSCLTGSALR